jgi:hypothetical protein
MDARQRRVNQPGALGKIAGGDAVELAGTLCALGLPGMRAIESDDPVELLFLSAVAEVVVRRREQERSDLALKIINTLAKSIK